MATKKTRLARLADAEGDASKKGQKKGHQIVSQDETWHRFRLFALENRLNLSEAFEIVVLVIDKYKSQPKLIGQKIFEAIERRSMLAEDEFLTFEDI